MRDAVGVRGADAPEHRAEEGHETKEQEIARGESEGTAQPRSPTDADSGDKEGEINTTVSADSAEVMETPGDSEDSPDDEANEGNGDELEEGKKEHRGVVGKFKAWREHEKELHRDHRGIMQAKPVRTAEWLLDNIEDGAHAVKDRFKMKARQPDVETEV